MQQELKFVDVTNVPELLHLAEEVQASRQPTVLTRNGEKLIEVTPVGPIGKKRAKTGILTEDDPLTQLVGTLGSEESTDASKKHEYLAQSHQSV
ncbi:MAG: hypothetical protein EXR51_06820 [Dehalococcoidia bacterium]|nr:hypothetical protein [Dehalococcoidia bacterium]